MKKSLFVGLCGMALAIVNVGGVVAHADSSNATHINTHIINHDESSNLVKNGDFSQDLTDWNLYIDVPDDNIGIKTDTDGNKYMDLNTFERSDSQISQIVPAGETDNYTFQFDGSPRNRCYVRAFFVDKDSNIIKSDTQLIDASDPWNLHWEHYSFNYHVEGVDHIKVVFQSSLYVDNISLTTE